MERLIIASQTVAFSLTGGGDRNPAKTNQQLPSQQEIGEQVQMSGKIVIIAMSLIGSAGIVGNCLSILVFSRPRMRSSVSELLIGLSIVDVLVIVFALIIFGAQAFQELVYHSVGLTIYLAYSLNYMYPVSMMVQTASVWFLVVITIERYVVVCFPLKARSICTRGRARLSLALLCGFAVLYNVIRFWEYKIVETMENNVTILSNDEALRKNTIYFVGYYSGMYLVVQFLLPFIILITLNVTIIRRVMKARRERKLMTTTVTAAETKTSEEHRIAIMMLCIIITFALCNTLAFVLNIIEANSRGFFTNAGTKLQAYVIMDTSNVLVVVNSSCNAIIYYAFSCSYRNVLKAMCKCRSSSQPDHLKYHIVEGIALSAAVPLRLTTRRELNRSFRSMIVRRNHGDFDGTSHRKVLLSTGYRSCQNTPRTSADFGRTRSEGPSANRSQSRV